MTRMALAGFLLNYLNVFLFFNIPFNLSFEESETLITGERIVVKKRDDLLSILSKDSSEPNPFHLSRRNPNLPVRFYLPNDLYKPHTQLVMTVSDVVGGQWYATISTDLGCIYTTDNYTSNVSISVSDIYPDIQYHITLHHVSGTSPVYGNCSIKLI